MKTAEPAPMPMVLVARPVPCRRCGGRGYLPVVACGWCAYMKRVSENAGLPSPALVWHFPEDLYSEDLSECPAFPCGHPFGGWPAERGQAECPKCEGRGDVLVRKTAEAWAKQDAKEARQKKQEASDAAKVLAEYGAAGGYSARQVRQMLRWLRPVCEAHCRQTGKPCPRPVVLGAVRCRQHGGLSTGPKTAEGRARIADSNRRRKTRKEGEPAH